MCSLRGAAVGGFEPWSEDDAEVVGALAVCGNRSLTGRPLWPYCLNFQGEASRLPVPWRTEQRLGERQRLAVVCDRASA